MSGERPTPSGGESHEDLVARHFASDTARWVGEYRRNDYHSRRYRIRARIASRMLTALRPHPGRLLDIGTGAGVQALAAHRAGWDVVGMDLTPEMIRTASTNQGPSWTVASAGSLPFGDCSFDAVLMLGVIGYTPEPPAALAEVRRVLTPGGTAIVSWHNRRSLLADASAATKAVPRRVLGAAGRNRATSPASFYASHNRDWTFDGFTELLDAAGFALVDHDGVDYGRFRPLGFRLWGERVDVGLSRGIEAMAAVPRLEALRRRAFTQIAAVTKDHDRSPVTGGSDRRHPTDPDRAPGTAGDR